MADTLNNPGLIASVTISKRDLLTADQSSGYPYVKPSAADTDEIIAIATADAVADEAVPHEKLEGQVTQVRSSGSVSAYDYLAPTTAGEVKTCESGDREMGFALEAGATADDLILAVVYHGHLRA